MNIVDIILGVLLILAFVSGYRKGLFVALASLVGLIAGILGAVYFSDFASAYISRWFDLGDTTTKWASFAVTFLGIVFLVSYLGRFLTKVADFTALGLLNKLLGGLFSAIQYAFIISVIFMFFRSSNVTGFVVSEEKKENSKLYQPIASLAPMVIPKVKEFFNSNTFKTETEEETLE